MTYIQRDITLQITLGQGASFDPSGSNVVTVSGHRVNVSLNDTLGTVFLGEARVRIYGLTPSLLNKLSSLNATTAINQQNSIAILAGDAKSGMAPVFFGGITLSQADMSEQPNTALNLVANAIGLQATLNLPPQSYPAGADAAVILSYLAAQSHLGFINQGCSFTLSTPYIWGSAKDQIEEVKRIAGFEGTIDPKNNLVIWPAGAARDSTIPLISPATGMVGYPTYWASEKGGGLSVTTVFNPNILVGGKVQIESSLAVANGTWQVYSLSHDLDSLVRDGQWFTNFKAHPGA